MVRVLPVAEMEAVAAGAEMEVVAAAAAAGARLHRRRGRRQRERLDGDDSRGAERLAFVLFGRPAHAHGPA